MCSLLFGKSWWPRRERARGHGERGDTKQRQQQSYLDFKRYRISIINKHALRHDTPPPLDVWDQRTLFFGLAFYLHRHSLVKTSCMRMISSGYKRDWQLLVPCVTPAKRNCP